MLTFDKTVLSTVFIPSLNGMLSLLVLEMVCLERVELSYRARCTLQATAFEMIVLRVSLSLKGISLRWYVLRVIAFRVDCLKEWVVLKSEGAPSSWSVLRVDSVLRGSLTTYLVWTPILRRQEHRGRWLGAIVSGISIIQTNTYRLSKYTLSQSFSYV